MRDNKRAPKSMTFPKHRILHLHKGNLHIAWSLPEYVLSSFFLNRTLAEWLLFETLN